VDDLEQRVAPAVVGGPRVEAAQALVGRVEHGGEDGVVDGELLVVTLRSGTARGSLVARQGHPVTFEDVRGAPCHREPQGLGEQQVLGAGSVHVRSPSPCESGRPAGSRCDAEPAYRDAAP